MRKTADEARCGRLWLTTSRQSRRRSTSANVRFWDHLNGLLMAG